MQLVLPPQIGISVLLGVSAGAVLKGGLEERLAAAGVLANVAVTVILRTPPQLGFDLQWAGFAADLLLFLSLLGLALRSAKYWPLAAAAFQLLAVLTHVAMLLDPRVNRWAYFTAIIIWTYALFIALGVGVWNHWREGRYLTSAEPAPAPRDTRR